MALPAEKGGALSILNMYYEKSLLDISNEYIFCVSNVNLKSSKNIEVLKFPWVKKSWLHRLFFDKCYFRKIVKNLEYNQVLSLQNSYIEGAKSPQIIYLQQSLQFSSFHFQFLRNPKMWLYQKYINYMIPISLRKASKIIVQTNWMKNKCIEKYGLPMDIIEVEKPVNLSIEVKCEYESTNKLNFLYPAEPLEYKNHIVILKTLKLIKKFEDFDVNVIFTFKGDENRFAKYLKKEAIKSDLPVTFSGRRPINEIYELYTKSVLLFPSLVETVGLPLIEAKKFKSPIIASGLDFTREVLGEYELLYCFDPLDPNDLLEKIKLLHNRFFS